MAEIVFAEQLKRLRKEKDLSQDNLASDLFISRQAISRWESGEAMPDINNLVKLAEILQVNLNELVLGQRPVKAEASETDITAEKTSLNGWEFLARYWWLLFPLMGMLGWLLSRI